MMQSQQQLLRRDRKCGCGCDDAIISLNVHLRGSYRRLCPRCILRCYSGSFCPVCFEVFDDDRSPPPRARVMCLTCPSIAHLSCVSSSSISPSSIYHCPSCSNPSFAFFDVCRGENKQSFVVNKPLAKQLLAAAIISVRSMSKAAAEARFEAEKKAYEAVLSRKRAHEALRRLGYLVAEEKKKNDTTPPQC